MLFLAPLYNYLASQYATRINHFALIKLTLQGLDKTIFYFLLFALVRVIWLLAVRKDAGSGQNSASGSSPFTFSWC